MKIVIGSDHAGYKMKQTVAEHLRGRGFEILDVGTDSEESVDYPIYGKATGEALMAGKADLGMVFCGTGIGISIAANKVKGVRCALVSSVELAEQAKKHNNANILAIGGRTTDPELAIRMTDAWLDAEFEGGRHARRVGLLDEM